MSSALTTWLVLVLGASAVMKARRPRLAADALATYGLHGAVARAALGLAIAAELAVAGALIAGASWAAASACGLFALFALLSASALARGRRGRPCACFGAASRLAPSTPARAAALAAAAGVLVAGWLPDAPSSYERALTVALALSAAAIGILAAALLALAREVGVLRLDRGTGALEIPQEGPPLGVRQPWALASPASARAMLRLAVFTSEGCPLCRQVAPAVAHVSADPLVALDIFDEQLAGPTWREAGVPGSPYAVALTLDGVVLAKGTFNGLGQLESILGTARLREREQPLAA